LVSADATISAAAGALPVGRVRDSSAPALAALVREAGGEPRFAGIVPDDRDVLARTLREALPESDVLVVSAGSSVGARDETAAAIASLGDPGIWCHGLALRPGKPTLLADCGGVPIIGLPGNPRSALVVFRLIGMPIVRTVGGSTHSPPEPSVRARLARDLPSAAGRLDVVQVRLAGGDAEPLFGSSSLLSILTAADGYLIVPEAATGLAAGSDVEVMLYR
jgi:molybdopterin molybdotransferase